MKRTSATAALLPLCIVAALAFAQSQAAPAHPQEPGLAPPAPTGVAAARNDGPPRADRDARACLDFVTNIGVIRCAEKYRHPSAHPPR